MHLDVDLTAAVISFLTAFLVSAVSGRFLIPALRNLKAGQTAGRQKEVTDPKAI